MKWPEPRGCAALSPRRQGRLLTSIGAVLMACLPGLAPAQDAPVLSGSLRLDYFSSSRHLDDVHGVGTVSGELKVKQRLSPTQRLEAEARLLREDVARKGRHDLRWLSAYWFGSFGDLDLRVGQQKLRWGKADVLNPTDFFTPIDFAVPLPLEEDRYLAVPAVRADWRLDDTKELSFVLEPDFTPSLLPRVRQEGVQVSEDRPSAAHRPQYGVRFTRTGEGGDWSVSAFDGYSTLPVLSWKGVADGRLQYAKDYPRARGVGADWAVTAGPWSFRLEAAQTHYAHDRDSQPVASSLFVVGGVDRSFDDVNINLQALYRRTPGYEKVLAASTPYQFVASSQNAALYNQLDKDVWGMSLRVAANWLNNTLQTELLYVGYFSPSNGLIRPLVTYAVTDNSKITLGAEYYRGPDVSFFGGFKKNSTVFAEFRHFL